MVGIADHRVETNHGVEIAIAIPRVHRVTLRHSLRLVVAMEHCTFIWGECRALDLRPASMHTQNMAATMRKLLTRTNTK